MSNTIEKAIDKIRAGNYDSQSIENVLENLTKYNEEDEELLFVLGDLLDRKSVV